MWSRLHDGQTCWFLGLPAAQYYVDFYLWELFFLNFKIRSLIELGTGQGALSIFFLLQSLSNEFSFDTFDIKYPGYLYKPVGRLLDFSSYFHLGDIFGDPKNKVINLLENRFHPILLYCDNGSKAKEIETFSPYLQAGDFIVTHDWKTEVNPWDIPHVIEQLEDIMSAECDELESLTRFFRKK